MAAGAGDIGGVDAGDGVGGLRGAATPERTGGEDILHTFEGRTAAELRLAAPRRHRPLPDRMAPQRLRHRGPLQPLHRRRRPPAPDPARTGRQDHPPGLDAGPGLLRERGARPLDGPQVRGRRPPRRAGGAVRAAAGAHRPSGGTPRLAVPGRWRTSAPGAPWPARPHLPRRGVRSLRLAERHPHLPRSRGVLFDEATRCDVFFITIKKSGASSRPPPATTTTPSPRGSSTGRARASPGKPPPPGSATSTTASAAAGCCCSCGRRTGGAR